MKKILIVLLSFLCAGCSKNHISQDYTHDEIYDLNESTEIIMQLIKENTMPKIMADQDPEQLKILLKNFSPSEMAVEAEALNYKGISALIFYHCDVQWPQLRKSMIEIAKKNPEIKFVQVDADKLFKVTQNAQIEEFPAIIFLKDRKEFARIEPINEQKVVPEIESILKKIVS